MLGVVAGDVGVVGGLVSGGIVSRQVSVGSSVTGGMLTVGGSAGVGTGDPVSLAAAAGEVESSSVVTMPTIAPATTMSRAPATRAAQSQGGVPGSLESTTTK